MGGNGGTSGKKRSSFLGSKLEKQLVGYAIAGAAGASLLAVPQQANADIVFTPVDITFTNGVVSIDLNHDGINDFNLTDFGTALQNGTRRTLDVVALGPGGGVLSSGSSLVPALKQGAAIGPHQRFRNTGLMVYLFSSSQSCCFLEGFWRNARNHFLGLRFEINGQLHYGWAVLSVEATLRPGSIKANLKGYAYDTVPNQPLRAGQRLSIIEPAGTSAVGRGTLGKLALGSLGLDLWRRRNGEEVTSE